MNDKRNTQSTDLKGKYEQPKVELYNFYELCGFYKRIKAGEEIK